MNQHTKHIGQRSFS